VTVDVEVVTQDGTVVQRGHDVWLVATSTPEHSPP
jgi:hypothetical protein